MPNSSDDPASAPAPNVVSETPAATAENSGEEAHLSDLSSPDGELRPPRRRRRRRRRPQPRAPMPEAPHTDRSRVGEESLAGEAGEPETTPAQASGLPPRRRRRRRRGPPHAVSQSPQLGGDVEIGPIDPSGAASPASGEAVTQSQLPEETAAGAPTGFRRWHRRPRRRVPTEPASGEPAEGGPEGSTEGVSTSTAGAAGRPRTGRPHQRRTSDASAQREGTRRGGPRQFRGQTRGRVEGGGGDLERQDRSLNARDSRDEGQRDGGPRNRRSRSGPPGRGRQPPPRKPEQKLYALESVVDRGFEDVSDESGEGGARRVHWTIVKRSVADQKSGKPMSAAYVLQKDGVEAEFPNLGAARAAVNKTIVHPEKLTLSKAEHVAAKASR